MTLWPHELGHQIRAAQFGNHFTVENFNFPRPDGHFYFSNDPPTNQEQIMATIGGAEMNHLIGLYGQKQAYERDYSFADELLYLALNKTQYIFYINLYDPVDTSDPNPWLDTTGDPIEYASFLFRERFQRSPVTTAGTVDPEAEDLYNEIKFASFWTLLDPIIWLAPYHVAKAYIKDEMTVTLPWVEIGGTRWMYGTQMNISPLGYELYLNLYTKFNDRLTVTYFKAGNPVKNYGMGMEFPHWIRKDPIELGFGIDIWNQWDYDVGGSVFLLTDYKVKNQFGITGKIGWKDSGYLMGQRLRAGFYGHGGFYFDF